MWLRSSVFAFVGVVVCSLAIEAGGVKDAKKDAPAKDVVVKDAKKDAPAKDAKKDAPAKDAKKDGVKDKKFEVPKDAILGTVKSVDVAKSSFTITLKDKKDKTFLVDKATEFYGPKGGDRGTGAAGLKDDTMVAGNEIRVVASADGKTAKDVYLPTRKAEKTEKTEKDKKDKK